MGFWKESTDSKDSGLTGIVAAIQECTTARYLQTVAGQHRRKSLSAFKQNIFYILQTPSKEKILLGTISLTSLI